MTIHSINGFVDGLEAIKGSKFKTIMLDPPWPIEWRPNKFNSYKPLGYPTMLISEIAAINIWDFIDAKHGAKVLLWATNEFLPEALGVAMKAWKLHYSKIFTYAKPHGMGRPPYNATEHCIIAYAGHPPNPRIRGSSHKNFYDHPRRESHSRKPDEIYKIFETFTEHPRLELFARTNRDKWICVGNQI